MHDPHESERYAHEGCTIVLGMEEDGEFADPRDQDNLGTMVCWHPDYVLGDEQMTNAEGRGAIHRDRRGSASTLFQTESGRTDFRDMRVVERYLRLARGAVVTMPLYLLDHSGISMSVGAPSPFDNPTVRHDHHGAGLGWDTSMIGYIYTTRERIAELCGEPREKEHAFYCPADWKGTPAEWIAEQLRNEVTYYDAWLRGSVYYWAVKDARGATLDCVGGYLIASDEDEKEMRAEAEATAKSYAVAREKRRRGMQLAGFRGPNATGLS